MSRSDGRDDAASPDAPSAIDRILVHTGAYQWLLLALCTLPQLMDGAIILLPTWTALEPAARCYLPGVDGPIADANFSSLPTDQLADYYADTMEPRQWCRACNVKADTHVIHNATGCSSEDAAAPCDDVLYGDPAPMKDSLQITLDMGCGHVIKRDILWSASTVGMAVGHLASSVASDRFGRKRVVLFCGTGMIVTQIGGVFAVYSYYAYISALFLGTVFGSGATLTTLVIALENSGPSFRAVVSNVANVPFTLGQIYVGLAALAFARFQMIHVCMAGASIFFVLYYFTQAESIRWLLLQDNMAVAEQQLKTAARLNKVHIDSVEQLRHELEDYQHQLAKDRGGQQKSGLVQFFRLFTSGCRPAAASIATIFAFFGSTMCYYGLAQNTGDLSSDIFVAYFVGATAELPAAVVSILSVNYVGRKPTMIAYPVMGGLCCIFAAAFPGTAQLCFALAGRLLIKVCVNTVYQYSAELFPTVVRQTAIAAGSLAARTGALLAPQLRYVLGPRFGYDVPMYAFGAVAVAAGLLAVAMPETRSRPPPDTVAQFCHICTGGGTVADTANARQYGSFSVTSANMRRNTDSRSDVPT